MTKVTHGTKRAVDEIRKLRERSGVFKNSPGMPVRIDDEALADLKYFFDLWWDSWIEPQLDYLEGKR
jgi:hypothetical protein